MSEITIRIATEADAEQVAFHVHRLLDELTHGAAPASEEILARSRAVLGSTRAFALIAQKDGVPVGVMTLSEGMAIFAGGLFGQIAELYIEPEFRSHGIAPRLLEAAQEQGRARGWNCIEVGAPPQPVWGRTLAFYLANGFKEIGPRLRLVI